MNPLLFQICMLISVPAESLPIIEAYAHKHNLTIEQTIEHAVAECIRHAHMYEDEIEWHPYYPTAASSSCSSADSTK